MRIRTSVVLAIASSLILIGAKFSFSEDIGIKGMDESKDMGVMQDVVIPKEEPVIRGGAVPDAQSEPEIQWVWGDVSAVDAQNKTLLIKYLDYETDQDREITVSVNEKTVFENIKSLDEIKPLDAVSVDYILSSDGKNIAANISLEKPEASPMNTAPGTESMPEDMPMPAQGE